MKRMLRAGLIGCGNIGALYDEGGTSANVYTHAGMYRQVAGLELVCASDVDEKRLQEFGNYWQVKRLYTDHEQMLTSESLDIVSIATPDSSHQEIIKDVLRLSPPRLIFSEKPLANSSAAAEEIQCLCLEKDVTLVVDYVRRWDENHQLLKEFVGTGGLGEMQNVVGYYVRGLKHNGCQLINLIQFLFGPITHVQALGAADCGSIPGDPSLDVRFGLQDGNAGYMMGLDKKGYSFSIYEMEIFGTKGRIRLLNGGQSISFFPIEGDPHFPNFKKISENSKPFWQQSTYGSALIHAGNELAAYLNGTRSSLENTADCAIADLRVIEAILSSGQHSGIVTKV